MAIMPLVILNCEYGLEKIMKIIFENIGYNINEGDYVSIFNGTLNTKQKHASLYHAQHGFKCNFIVDANIKKMELNILMYHDDYENNPCCHTFNFKFDYLFKFVMFYDKFTDLKTNGDFGIDEIFENLNDVNYGYDMDVL